MNKVSLNINLIVFILYLFFSQEVFFSQEYSENKAVIQNFDTSIFINAYILSDVKAINKNSNYTEFELNQFSTLAAADYNKFHFVISNKLNLMYYFAKSDTKRYNNNHLEKTSINFTT